MKLIKTLRLVGLLAASAGAASAQTVLKISRVPADTPATDTLFVAGSFNGWNPHHAAYRLDKKADGTYQIILPASLGPVEYKFTRGSWESTRTAAALR